MYNDTDSLMIYYPGSREDFIMRNKDVLDLSLFPDLAKKLGIDPNENKMKPGWLKLEPVNGDTSPVKLLYARAPKMYLISTANKHKTKTKGFQSGMISKEDLQYAENIERTMYTIRSVKHEPELTEIKRKVNNENNNKRIKISESLTLPHGYVASTDNEFRRKILEARGNLRTTVMLNPEYKIWFNHHVVTDNNLVYHNMNIDKSNPGIC